MLSNDYQERSGTLLDFAYIRFPGTIPTGINPGSTLDLPLFSSDYETIVYTNNIPVTSEGFDLRTDYDRIIHCFYHFDMGNGKNDLIQLGFRLIFNTTINTVCPPSFYYNVGDNVYANTSGFFTVPNWQHIIKGIGIQNKMSQNAIYINNLTFLVMRFNYDTSLIDNNQTYFKENENTFYQNNSTLDTSRGHVIDTVLPTPKLKCYTAYSKISGTKETWKTRGYFQHGITDIADEATANMPNSIQMFQGVTMSMVTCWCSNDSLAEVSVPVSTDRGNYVIPQGLGNNYTVYYMPPLYNNLGNNYSFLPIIQRPGNTQKINVYSAFDTEGTFLKIESFSFIGNTRINNYGNGYYSVLDTAVLKNLYSLDPETNCGFTTTPYKDHPNKETSIFQMQVSTGLMYLEFVENTETPQEYFQIQTNYLGSKFARLTTTLLYNWGTGKFIHYNNNPIVVFIEYTISSSSVDSYIDTSIQLTFEPQGNNADYTTVTPSFDPARTINLDIVRYIDFGYTAETLNFSRNCINIMHNITFLEANQYYYMFIRAIDNINHSRIIFNLTKLFFVEIEK